MSPEELTVRSPVFVLLLLLAGAFSSCEYNYPDYSGERPTSFCIADNSLYAGTMDGGVMMYSSSEGKWIQRSDGLAGSSVSCMMVNGNSVFAGVTGGVYRSRDGGVHWDSLPVNVYWPNVLVSNGTAMYVAGNGEGIWKSSDDGNTWTMTAEDLATDWTYALLAGDSGIYAGTTQGIYFLKEKDHAYWMKDSGEAPERVDAMITIGNVHYAGDVNGNVFASQAGSHHWSFISRVCDKPINHFCFYATVLFADTDNGTFISRDTGKSWTNVPYNVFGEAGAVDGGFIGKNDSLFASMLNHGVYLSLDTGRSWQAFNEGMVGKRTIDWERSIQRNMMYSFILVWVLLWILPARFLWHVQGGKRIYWINFLLGIVLTTIAMLIFCTRPSGRWDFGNAERGIAIVALYTLWGVIFLIYSMVKRRNAYRGV